jgi:hypothetical protein
MRKYKIQEHEKKTLVWWNNRREKIDTNPYYQRKGSLWTDADKAYLIDSIVNGFDIPKIYLCDFTWINNEKLNPNKKMYSVIDGKQRLEAIFGFFKNKIALNDDFIYFKNEKLQAGGMKYSDLKIKYPDIAEKFDEFNLSVVTVITDDIEAINELFVRLNKSKPLTGAEIRNAMKGKLPGIIRNIADHDFFKNYCSFADSRGQDKNAAAKILLFEYYEKPKDTKKKSLDQFIENPDIDHEKIELSYRKNLDNLDLMCTVFLPKDKILKSAGLIPVYYEFLKDKDDSELSVMRAFLTKFEYNRKNSKEKIFANFSIYNRSTNDENSFKKRLEILEKLFKTKYES